MTIVSWLWRCQFHRLMNGIGRISRIGRNGNIGNCLRPSVHLKSIQSNLTKSSPLIRLHKCFSSTEGQTSIPPTDLVILFNNSFVYLVEFNTSDFSKLKSSSKFKMDGKDKETGSKTLFNCLSLAVNSIALG